MKRQRSVEWSENLRERPVGNAVAEAAAFLIGEAEVNSQMDARVDDFLRGLGDPAVLTLGLHDAGDG